MIYTEKISVAALPPFRFDISSEIFANGDKQIRSYVKGLFWQVIRAGIDTQGQIPYTSPQKTRVLTIQFQLGNTGG